MEHHQELKRRGAWTSEEDDKLRHYVNTHGAHHWDTMARNLAIGRSGNSCRLRWVNYLSPDIVRGGIISDDEMLQILTLHSKFGNRWSKIAQHLPGRTDNDVKNFWNTRVKKEAKQLNCDVESEEFRQIMTARLRDRIQSAAVPPPTTTTLPPLAAVAGGHGGGTAAPALGADDFRDLWGHLGNGTHYTLDDVPPF